MYSLLILIEGNKMNYVTFDYIVWEDLQLTGEAFAMV
jgi:hypothetical protein